MAFVRYGLSREIAMRHRPPWSLDALCSLATGTVLAILPGDSALAQDATRLSGEMFIGGATLVDPPSGEATNTPAYLTVTGPAALRLYRTMQSPEDEDLCRGDGHKMKRAGTLSCSIDGRGQVAVCDFGVDLRSGMLAGGRPC
jgi:hypothetical protein